MRSCGDGHTSPAIKNICLPNGIIVVRMQEPTTHKTLAMQLLLVFDSSTPSELNYHTGLESLVSIAELHRNCESPFTNKEGESST